MPNYDIPIGFRHRLYPQVSIRTLHIVKYAIAMGGLPRRSIAKQECVEFTEAKDRLL
jgi:hypothetical protein